jgi:hypothetical protein
MTLYWWKFLKFILNKNLLEVKNKEGRGKRGALNDRARASKYRGRRVRGALVLSARSKRESADYRLHAIGMGNATANFHETPDSRYA